MALFTRFFPTLTPPSHKEVLDMEVQLFHERFTERDPKFLTDYIQKMASGEAPFFPVILSMVYDKLVENLFLNPTCSSALGKSSGGQRIINPTPHLQASTSDSSATSSSTSNISTSFAFGTTSSSTISFAPPYSLGAPTPTPRLTPSRVTTESTWLKCARCGERAQLRDLYDGLHCPQCSEKGKNGRGKKGRPFMSCLRCNNLRVARLDVCAKSKCGVRFM